MDVGMRIGGMGALVRVYVKRPSPVVASIAAALCATLGVMIVAPRPAAACSLDGKPTAFADGRRAVLSTDRDTRATMRTWAPFSFAGRYRARMSLRLAEDQAALQVVLPPGTLRYPWTWTFGDGTSGRGWTVTHRYAHPGVYRITIKAYYPTWQEYIPFDTVRITVVR